MRYFFFFQAEDGIRDHCVTGVQTCALPIWKPARFISGIVTVPTVMTFETMLPEIDPKSDDPTIAILAGPPRYLPISAIAMSLKKVEPPALSSTWPKKTYTTTTVAMILIAMPRIALESHTR